MGILISTKNLEKNTVIIKKGTQGNRILNFLY